MTEAEILRALNFVAKSVDFIELRDGVGFKVDLRYASTNNITGRNVYGPFNKAFLHRIAAEKLSHAYRLLRESHPGHGLIIFDALRPGCIQRVMWNHVKGTEGERYFANPEIGSVHSYGFAIDLSVTDPQGRELDMGAGFDDFRDISAPSLEAKYLATGQLTTEHVANRKILRDAMVGAGFIQLPHEWWHYDALPKVEVRTQFRLIE